MVPAPAMPQPSRFHAARPTDLRTARPWHRLSFIVNELPRVLASLAPELHVGDGGRILDYGCADRPYHHLFGQAGEIVAADLPGNPDAGLELAPDGSVPLPDASFDAVLSTQVLEHVTDPALHLAECHRLLRPGGRALISTHGTMPYHPDPVDLWRWTCAGLREQVEATGLRVVRFEGVMGLAATGMQLVQDGLVWRSPVRLRCLWPLVWLITQSLARLLDRVETPESRRLNAMVYVVVAERP